MNRMKWIFPFFFLAAAAQGQGTPGSREVPALPKARDILQRTLEIYGGAKTYQGTWSFTTERGTSKTLVTMSIKAKTPNRLYFKVAPAADQKPAPGQDAIPELLVVLDGKTAYFLNSTSNLYYKVPLPKVTLISPLMFIPQIPAASQVELKESRETDGKVTFVLGAETIDGSKTQMEIAAQGMRIRRIVSEKMLGPIKENSTIVVELEQFGGEIADKEFNFKAPRGAKEIPAPAGTEALFGVPGT